MRHRKLNRLPGRSYSENGWYFVTICVDGCECVLGRIENQKMILGLLGELVKKQWLWLEKQYDYIRHGEWIIMPNHIHGVVIIDVGTGRDLSLQRECKSLSGIIGAFKTTSSKLMHQAGYSSFKWQRSFYNRIIRSEDEMVRIRQYIRLNPERWNRDRNNIY